jgi:serine palmitoyltransferase
VDSVATQVQRLPGSSIVLRYIKSSYQNDPVRSAVELFLFLFAVRYLLAPSYSVPKHKGFVEFTEDVSSDLF